MAECLLAVNVQWMQRLGLRAAESRFVVRLEGYGAHAGAVSSGGAIGIVWTALARVRRQTDA